MTISRTPSGSSVRLVEHFFLQKEVVNFEKTDSVFVFLGHQDLSI